MADGRVTFAPPPRIPGVTGGADQSPRDALMQQLAAGGGENEEAGQQQMAAPLLAQGIMLLQQAAKLDPRIAPLVSRALAPLQGGEGSPELSKQKHVGRRIPDVGGTI